MQFGVLLTVWPALLRGTIVTVELTGAVLLLATPLGILVAELRNIRQPAVRTALAVASWAFRGIPPLLILFFVFFGLPQFGVTLPPFPSAVIGMTAYMAFYFAEAFRAGYESIPAGQWRAAEALGLSNARTLFRVILPQTVPATLPSFMSHATDLLKGTTLAAAVAVPELTAAAKQVFVVTYRPIEILVAAGVIYAVLDAVLLVLQALGEGWARRFRLAR